MTQISESAIKTLKEIKNSENATEYLSNRFECCSSEQKEELRSILRELSRLGCIKIMWADNSPWYVNVDRNLIDTILNKESIGTEKSAITIGNNNTIKNSIISSGPAQMKSTSSARKTFVERHPVLITTIVSLGVRILLMFSFWDRIISFVENLF